MRLVQSDVGSGAVARAVGELRGWLLAPGRLERVLTAKDDTEGERLARLDCLPPHVIEALRLSRHDTPRPSAADERAYLGDVLTQLAHPESSSARSASLPYLGRALRCYDDARKVEDKGDDHERFAWLVDDVMQSLGWAADAQDVATGGRTVQEHRATQGLDQSFGHFLGHGGCADHPELIGPGERSRAFRWQRWAKQLCERDYLSRAAKQLSYLLADFADEDGVCWPSQSRLMQLSGMSKNGVRGGLRELERDLALTVEATPGGRGSTRYRLLSSQLSPVEVASAQASDEDVPF